MNRRFSYSGVALIIWISISSCNKGHDREPYTPWVDKPIGEFTSTINGKMWNPDKYSALYYFKWQQLYITASDSSHTLETAIMLDSFGFLKNYLLESHGENSSILIKDSIQYFSDLNLEDAGGNFLLTKFDTVNMKLSGQLNFNASASGRNDKINFASTSIKDIKILFAGYDFPGNQSKSTVIGTKTAEWLSKDVLAEVSCRSGSFERVKIQIFSPLENNPRRLVFNVPISKPGVYKVVPDTSPYNSDCSNENVRSVYNLHFGGPVFYPIDGTFTIIDIDTVLKKMTATFDVTFKDPVSQQIIRIKNGTLKLEKLVS